MKKMRMMKARTIVEVLLQTKRESHHNLYHWSPLKDLMLQVQFKPRKIPTTCTFAIYQVVEARTQAAMELTLLNL